MILKMKNYSLSTCLFSVRFFLNIYCTLPYCCVGPVNMIAYSKSPSWVSPLNRLVHNEWASQSVHRPSCQLTSLVINIIAQASDE